MIHDLRKICKKKPRLFTNRDFLFILCGFFGKTSFFYFFYFRASLRQLG